MRWRPFGQKVRPYACELREQFSRIIVAYIIIGIPLAALDLVQIAAGPDSIIDTYVSHTDAGPTLAYFGTENFVRTSGNSYYLFHIE
jgi:hypothetical protein